MKQIAFLLGGTGLLVLFYACATTDETDDITKEMTSALVEPEIDPLDKTEIADDESDRIPTQRPRIPPVDPVPPPIPDPGPWPEPIPYPEPLPPPPPQPQEDEKILEITDVPATFPGGDGAMKKFIMEKLKYPEIAKEAGIEGRVYISFVVEKDGSLTNIAVLKGKDGGLNEESIRVVKSFPKFVPAQNNGKIVRSKVQLPITFSLE